MKPRLITGTSWLQLLFGLVVAGLVWWVSGKNGSVALVIVIAIGYLGVLRYGTAPLAQYIARSGYSIRWKFELAIVAISLVFLSVGLISFASMDFMHRELHDIQEIDAGQPGAMMRAVEELEDTHHGALFSLTPYLGALGVLAGAALGSAMAWSVIVPVRRMEEAMSRIDAGDFSQLIEVENADEIGQRAVRINQTTESLARLQEATQAESRGARLIQNTLLPKEVPVLDGWKLAAHYRPARAVGGDFYDFLHLADGRLGIVMGDVTDKGVPAALVMATTRTILRSVAEGSDSPAEVLSRVNDQLCPDIPANMFVTCIYSVLDTVSGQITYANAGHGLPYCRLEGKFRELRATGMPLGMVPGMTYEEKQTILAHGESVLFHSDGLVEAHNPQREMFGFPRLKSLVASHPEGEDLISRLLEELSDFAGPDWDQEDDVTLVSLQRAAVDASYPEVAAHSKGDRRTLSEFELRSEPGNERGAMERVAESLQDVDLSQPRVDRLKTAVAEAAMNAMEHGNGYRAELPVAIQVSASDSAVAVRITDRGGGQSTPDAETPDLEAKLAGEQMPRGWGVYLIKNMVDEMQVSDDGSRHTVELIMYLGGAGDGS